MPGIGEHRTGGVTSICLWPQNSVVQTRNFHYYRLVVTRTERQLKDVVQTGHGGDDGVQLSQLPTISITNFKLLSSGRGATDCHQLSPNPVAGLDTKVSGSTVLTPKSAMNLSYAKPWEIVDWNDGGGHTGVDWSLAATDPEEDRQNSFISCGAGVLELYFEQPVCAEAYTWDVNVAEQNQGVSQAPERWQLFASHDWVNWICVDDCSEISLDDIPETGIKRDIHIHADAVITQAPSASPDLRHVPMVVSTGALSVRVWSVCADFATLKEEKRGAKGISLSMMRGHEDVVTCCAVTTSGAVVSGSRDCTVRIWRAHAGECLAKLPASSPILCVTTFDSPSSMHLQTERTLLRKGAQLHCSMRYSIRLVDMFKRGENRLSAVGGDIFVSAGNETLDFLPIPSCGDAGEDSFEAFAWRLEAAPEPNSIYISCQRDDNTLYLSHDSGNVVLAAVEYRSPWEIEWQKKSAIRPCKPKHSLARGRNGDAMVNLHLFYRITSRWRMFPAAEDTGAGVELLPGSVIQIVDAPVRPFRDESSLWQQVVIVGEESDVVLMYQQRIGGWVRAAFKAELLIDEFAEPVEHSVAFGRLRCKAVSVDKPAYLELRKSGSLPSATASRSGTEQERVTWQLASRRKGHYFKFEEALPETIVVAGTEDGTAKIWSNAALGSQWAEKRTDQAVKHAGSIQQVHLVATADAEASSEGMLLITCSKEVHETDDQTIGIWRIDSGVWSCVCRLHPMIVKDYIAGMVKYIDPGNTGDFKLTYADPNVTSLTANDLLRIRGQYESLFEKLVKSLRLVPAQESIADRSHSRPLEPETSFKRERKDDPEFEDGDCYYWIQSSEHMGGHGPTFVKDQRLAIEDCEVGMVVREKDTPSDRIGGLYAIVSIDGVSHAGAKTGFCEKLFSPEKLLKAMGDAFADEQDSPTITVSRLDDLTGRPDMSTLNERGRHPAEFTRAGFWEGYHPSSSPDWLLFFLASVPYDWSVWLKERGIGIVQLLSFIFSWPAMLWSFRRKLTMNGGDEELTFGATEEDTDWARLFESAKTGQPVEPMVVPLPGAGGMYPGGKKSWDNLLKIVHNHDHEDVSLLHACVSYCAEHKEENNSLLGLEVPETIIQFKWYKYGQKRTMEAFR